MVYTNRPPLGVTVAFLLGVFTLTGSGGLAFPAYAQAPSAQQREAAGEAYDQGTSAYLGRDYGTAAQWFETAHRLVPSAAALLQAVRAHDRAGNQMRAATLAIRLMQLYPGYPGASRTAQRILNDAEPRYVRVKVSCEACRVDLDGTLQEFPAFFMEPLVAHTVTAAFRTGEKQQQVRGKPGESVELRFEAPPPPAVRDVAPPTPRPAEPLAPSAPVVISTAPLSSEPRQPHGLSPVFTWVGLGLTAVAGGVTVWSAADMYAGADAYERAPTPDGLSEGRARERRTNILIGTTAVLGAATLGIALFATNWQGDAGTDRGVRAKLQLQPGGAMASLEGRLW